MRMVEKMAKAILAKVPEGYGMTEAEAIEYARAVLPAMRESTDAMARKADGLTDLVGPYEEANTPEARLDEFKCAWRVMIDKAIQESGE